MNRQGLMEKYQWSVEGGASRVERRGKALEGLALSGKSEYSATIRDFPDGERNGLVFCVAFLWKNC